MDSNTIFDCILYQNIHIVNLETLAMLATDPLKLNNVINTCLINLNIILYNFSSLNIYEYLEYH